MYRDKLLVVGHLYCIIFVQWFALFMLSLFFVYIHMSSGSHTCCVLSVGCVLVVGEGGVHMLHIILLYGI